MWRLDEAGDNMIHRILQPEAQGLEERYGRYLGHHYVAKATKGS